MRLGLALASRVPLSGTQPVIQKDIVSLWRREHLVAGFATPARASSLTATKQTAPSSPIIRAAPRERERERERKTDSRERRGSRRGKLT